MPNHASMPTAEDMFGSFTTLPRSSGLTRRWTNYVSSRTLGRESVHRYLAGTSSNISGPNAIGAV
jgi:hypothetical protein